jgi:hypothetical protein
VAPSNFPVSSQTLCIVIAPDHRNDRHNLLCGYVQTHEGLLTRQDPVYFPQSTGVSAGSIQGDSGTTRKFTDPLPDSLRFPVSFTWDLHDWHQIRGIGEVLKSFQLATLPFKNG